MVVDAQTVGLCRPAEDRFAGGDEDDLFGVLFDEDEGVGGDAEEAFDLLGLAAIVEQDLP